MSRSVKLWFASSVIMAPGAAAMAARTHASALPGSTFNLMRVYPASAQRRTAAAVSLADPIPTTAPAGTEMLASSADEGETEEASTSATEAALEAAIEVGDPCAAYASPTSCQSGLPTILPYRSHSAGSIAPHAMGCPAASAHAANEELASPGCRNTSCSTSGASTSCSTRTSWSSVSGRYQSVANATHSPRPVRPLRSVTSTMTDSRCVKVPFGVLNGATNGRRMRYSVTRATSMRSS